MVSKKSLDEVEVIAASLSDVQTLCSDVFSHRALRLTIQKMRKRTAREGLGFLTKTLPRLGKMLDRALSGELCFDAAKCGFSSMPGSKLPRFLGELFGTVFSSDGMVVSQPSIANIRHLRCILYLFYKYEIPYGAKQESDTVSAFVKTEADIASFDDSFNRVSDQIDKHCASQCGQQSPPEMEGDSVNAHTQLDLFGRRSCFLGMDFDRTDLVRRARQLLNKLFESFDPTDILPRHGPGAVATRERLWEKWQFKSIPSRLLHKYPFDAYFCASLGHVCDSYREFNSLETNEEPSARVCLVPKDSRGPRLISCEPLVFQYVQQGLGAAIVELVESHPLTKWNIHFTNQQPNQFGALLGSKNRKYATLDLKEASDRVSVGLVRLLFPEKLYSFLAASRSLSTTLPDGRVINLRKFAPMGSCLCFPILALTIWAILTAGETDEDARESILVYGDDVIVETAKAAHAIELLESFGLLVNRDKSCINGFFRESCGVDAYFGEVVTPLRIRSRWSSSPSPDAFLSWVAYANSMWDRQYYNAYWYIAENLYRLYGPIPEWKSGVPPFPALRCVPESWRLPRQRYNRALQRRERYVLVGTNNHVSKEISGWSMLLRYFTEGARPLPKLLTWSHWGGNPPQSGDSPMKIKESFEVRSYTERRTIKLVRRWR